MINKTFENLKINKANTIEIGNYENCEFIDCNFSDTDLSKFSFLECKFMRCNLSNAMLRDTSLKDVRFEDSKLLGLSFFECNKFLFSVAFEKCNLSFSSFYKLKMKKTIFKNCLLQEVDFNETDLSSALFDNCDFSNAQFNFTNLEKADLRTSFHYIIDPEQNRIKKTKFSMAGITGLLVKYDIEVE